MRQPHKREEMMNRQNVCRVCQQVLPRIVKGDFVQDPFGIIGIAYLVGTRYVSVTILSGPNRGVSGLWTQQECHVVHGYLHIDRRAR